MESLTQQQIAQFKQAFALFDKDGDNIIQVSELPLVIRSLYQTPTQKQLKQWMKEIDPDQTGKVDFPEFLSLMARKYKQPDTEDELIESMISIFTPQGPTISAKTFKSAMTTLGQTLNQQQIQELFKQIGFSKQEPFNYQQFIRIILSK